MVPPLTTISVDFDNLGRQTGSLLLAVLRGEGMEPTRRVTDVGMHLIQRASTATGVA
jgi:DNA-binding LacI/PurR family transcriptional regulator